MKLTIKNCINIRFFELKLELVCRSPVPPPPNTSASMTSLDSIDLLPPPPPEMCYGQTENHYHSSPVTSPLGPPKPFPVDQKSLPPAGPSSANRPKPPTLKKSNSVQKSSSRKISFDDNVQMIISLIASIFSDYF